SWRFRRAAKKRSKFRDSRARRRGMSRKRNSAARSAPSRRSRASNRPRFITGWRAIRSRRSCGSMAHSTPTVRSGAWSWWRRSGTRTPANETRERGSANPRLTRVRLLTVALDVALAVIGLGFFIYGDVATNRTVRVIGVIVVTVAIVGGAILAVTRERDT